MKAHNATAHTSHLLDATVQFLTEMIIVEILEPVLTREQQADLYNVPVLSWHLPGPPESHRQGRPQI